MTNSEFSNEFDVLYNNIMSNAAPGLNEYEKSVFLTKAQDEIVKAYFNPRLNKTLEGFDGNEKRQIDFSMIMRTKVYTSFDDAELDINSNSKKVSLIPEIMMFINEFADVAAAPPATELVWYSTILDTEEKVLALGVKTKILDGSPSANYYFAEFSLSDDTNLEITLYSDEYQSNEVATISIPINSIDVSRVTDIREVGLSVKTEPIITDARRLVVVPLDYKEYIRVLNKPYKRPLKNLAWRLITNNGDTNSAEIIIGPNDYLLRYVIRYIKKPRAIILLDLDPTVTLDGNYEELSCELDSILHQEILQRAVELAKAAYTGDLNSQVALGVNSQTDLGMLASK